MIDKTNLEFVVIVAKTEAEARAEFSKKYPWGSEIAPTEHRRDDWYFPVAWKRVFEYRKAQVTG